MFNNKTLRRLAVAGVLASGLLANTTAQAAAIFDALASLTLTVTDIQTADPGNLSILGQASVDQTFTSTGGNGPATANQSTVATPAAQTALGIGDSVTLSAATNGSASNGGNASGDVRVSGTVDILNASFFADATVFFRATYQASVTATVDVLGTQIASALALIDLFIQPATPLVTESLFADAGGNSDNPVDSFFDFSVSIPAFFGGETLGFSVRADGSAAAAVPVPAPVFLLLPLAAGLLLRRARSIAG